MRALIAGVVFVGGVCTACTHSASNGFARYSGDTAPTPVVVRRDAPVWPTATAPAAPAPGMPAPVVTYAPAPAPSYAPPRTSAPQPIVLSSRSSPTYAPPSYAAAPPNRASTTLPPPASRARTAAELAAALRPINATCPVMLGTPVDPSVTASYQGRVVAFSDAKSRTAWLAEPERYTRNLPGTTGFGSSSDGAVFAAAPSPRAPSSRMEAPAYVPLPPTVTSRPTYAEPAPMYAPPPYPSSAPAAPSSAPAAVLSPTPLSTPAPAVTRPAAPAPQPVAAPEDEDAGGVCTGGNCGLPPRRK